MDAIIQGSPEWLEAKQSKVSASEIFSLVHHYCKKDLEAMGFDLAKERPFRTVQELFLKVKFGAKLSEIDPIHSEFGNGMEPYIAYRLGQELPQLSIERSKQYIENQAFHPLAACSPDGYVELGGDIGDCDYLDDFDKTCKINFEWDLGALELKTANYFANFDVGGCRLQYLFQLQFQLMVMSLKWGILAVLMPKSKEYDDPFFKGKTLGKLELYNFDLQAVGVDGLKEFYDLRHYIYPELKGFQALIMKALNCFQEALDKYDTDQSVFPRNSEDLTGLQREKQLWGQLWADHYGKKQLAGEDELDKLFNERYQAQVEKMFAEQAFEVVNNQILQLVKQRGDDAFCEIKGTEHRMSYIKNGQVRFYRLKGVA